MTHAFSMKEIALQAGVSLATVDRVLHGRPGVRAATQRRVRQAQLELERQQRQVGLQGRRFLIDLVMETPTRFSRIVRDALDSAMRRMHPAVFRVREHVAETWAADELVDLLDALARRGSHGVLLKAPDVPVVADAAARLQAKGIPVVTLVTDIHPGSRSAYVGLDNRSAGQTAAYLMASWLGPAPTDILVSSSGQRFQGEGERIQAFAQAMSMHQPGHRVRVLDTGLGLHAPTVAVVAQLLARCPEVAAVYSVGGANAAILAAFDQAQRPCRAFIGHDLDEDNLALLRAGRLSSVLHHDLLHDLHMACQVVMQAHGAAPAALTSTRSNVEVITPFNLPGTVASVGHGP
ncbi:LacI family DNA-binding transcriptional regulator [Sphaerotilus mobilis]|uniref:LacI family transcriptional regulator n=1 Tax=Sphaerotilus mobilis TaxID=47994 RepID=A0A4Q7L8B7_9BURK|nr:LacI family DNA-binding transcriptional regulator [Sphaerotilus mobilis]RZS46659.1 LacI family transcriptional regulator [Sphaerotilus mobilis]